MSGALGGRQDRAEVVSHALDVVVPQCGDAVVIG